MLILCRFLKKLDLLRTVVPARALPILSCLERLQEVKAGCFGWDLAEDYRERIRNFTESVKYLKRYGQVGLEVHWYRSYLLAGSLEDQGKHHVEDPHDVLPPGDPADQAWQGPGIRV